LNEDSTTNFHEKFFGTMETKRWDDTPNEKSIKPVESPTYRLSDTFSDFYCLDRFRHHMGWRGYNVFMDIEGVWHRVKNWDCITWECKVVGKGVVKPTKKPYTFIVSDQDFHLTKRSDGVCLG
jgi:hypothetical protein